MTAVNGHGVGHDVDAHRVRLLLGELVEILLVLRPSRSQPSPRSVLWQMMAIIRSLSSKIAR